MAFTSLPPAKQETDTLQFLSFSFISSLLPFLSSSLPPSMPAFHLSSHFSSLFLSFPFLPLFLKGQVSSHRGTYVSPSPYSPLTRPSHISRRILFKYCVAWLFSGLDVAITAVSQSNSEYQHDSQGVSAVDIH